MTHRSDLVERRLDMVRRFKSSGMTAAAFAQEEGVSLGTLSNWRKRAAAIDQPPVFDPVEILPDRSEPSGIVARVQLPGGIAIEVAKGADQIEIATLVRAVTC